MEANLRRSFVSTAPVTRPSYVFLYSPSATAIALILLSIVHICAHQAKEIHLFHIGLQCLARRRRPGGAQALAPISLKRRNSGDTPALRLARCWALEPPASTDLAAAAGVRSEVAAAAAGVRSGAGG